MKPVVALEERSQGINPLLVPMAALAFALVVFAFFALAREKNMLAIAVSGAFVLVAAGALAFVWRLLRSREKGERMRLRLVAQPRVGQNLSAILPVPGGDEAAVALEACLRLTQFHYGADGRVLDEVKVWEREATFPLLKRPQGVEAQIEIPIPADLPPADDPGWDSPAVTSRTKYRRWRLELQARSGSRPFKRTYPIQVKSATA